MRLARCCGWCPVDELKINEYESFDSKRTTVTTAYAMQTSAQLWKRTVLSNGAAELQWGAYGNASIAEAKAFHAALGKAIEIAEGYQRELEESAGP